MNACNVSLMKHQLSYFEQEYLLTENTTTDTVVGLNMYYIYLYIVNGLSLFQARLTSYHLNYKNTHSTSTAFKFKKEHKAVSPRYDNVRPDLQYCYKDITSELPSKL